MSLDHGNIEFDEFKAYIKNAIFDVFSFDEFFFDEFTMYLIWLIASLSIINCLLQDQELT